MAHLRVLEPHTDHGRPGPASRGPARPREVSSTPEEGSNGTKPVEIFISYAHLDDETALASEEGWITLLHRMLELRLAQLLGERPRVWRDPQMIGNAPITRSLEEKLSSAELMISVITPRYLKSDWCQREIQTFFERFGEPTRIFKVVKTQVPLERIPEPVRDSLSYLFFRQDPDTKRVRELKPQAPEFDDRLYDLAYDLRLTIERVETHGGGEPAAGPAPADGLTVFLADTTHDLEEMHERIRRELGSTATGSCRPGSFRDIVTPRWRRSKPRSMRATSRSTWSVAPTGSCRRAPRRRSWRSRNSFRAGERTRWGCPG